MTKPSDNDLDKLIQEAGGHYHATGASPDWEQMHVLLDEHMPARKEPGRKSFFLLVLLFICLLVGGPYLYFATTKQHPLTSLKQHPVSKNANRPVPIHPKIASTETTKGGAGLQQPILPLKNKNKQPSQRQIEVASNTLATPHHPTAGETRAVAYPGEVAENSLPVEKEGTANSSDKNEFIPTITHDSKITTIPPNKSKDFTDKLVEQKAPTEETISPNKPADEKNTTNNKKKKYRQKKIPIPIFIGVCTRVNNDRVFVY